MEEDLKRETTQAWAHEIMSTHKEHARVSQRVGVFLCDKRQGQEVRK